MNTSGPAAPSFLYRSEAFAEDLPDLPVWSESERRPRRVLRTIWVAAALFIGAGSTALAWIGYRI